MAGYRVEGQTLPYMKGGIMRFLVYGGTEVRIACMVAMLLIFVGMASIGSAADESNSIIQKPIILVNSSVFEGEKEMMIFSDGSKGYGKIVRHSYSLPGNYTIRLKITSEDAEGIKDKMIAIRSTPAPVIWIEKKVNPEIEHGAATTGGKVAVTIKVENRRDEEIFDVDVKDEFPEGKFKLVSGDTSMDLTSLKSGESKILKYELRALEAGYFVLKPATLTYKDESGVQHSNKSNTAEVMVRAPPPGLLIPEFVALFVIVGLLAVAVVAAYLVLRGLK